MYISLSRTAVTHNLTAYMPFSWNWNVCPRSTCHGRIVLYVLTFWFLVNIPIGRGRNKASIKHQTKLTNVNKNLMSVTHIDFTVIKQINANTRFSRLKVWWQIWTTGKYLPTKKTKNKTMKTHFFLRGMISKVQSGRFPVDRNKTWCAVEESIIALNLTTPTEPATSSYLDFKLPTPSFEHLWSWLTAR